jgi:hypothetical protein
VLKTYIIGEVLVMVSRELKVTMLEAVDNQLSMNEPKCTKDTFERLIASGYSPQEAKESIAEFRNPSFGEPMVACIDKCNFLTFALHLCVL